MILWLVDLLSFYKVDTGHLRMFRVLVLLLTPSEISSTAETRFNTTFDRSQTDFEKVLPMSTSFVAKYSTKSQS